MPLRGNPKHEILNPKQYQITKIPMARHEAEASHYVHNSPGPSYLKRGILNSPDPSDPSTSLRTCLKRGIPCHLAAQTPLTVSLIRIY
jgi:hypothetical protein